MAFAATLDNVMLGGTIMKEEHRDERGRAVMRRLESELRPLLLAWDPIGASPPEDEYDCVMAPLLVELRQGSSAAELAEWLGAHAEDHFGVTSDPEADREAATAILAWWDDVGDELPHGVSPSKHGRHLP
jgi:hypothetical protein